MVAVQNQSFQDGFAGGLRPAQEDYSGMSGGPIFWSTEDSYGIFGIIYEGGVGSELANGKSVHIYGEHANKDEILKWISQVNA